MYVAVALPGDLPRQVLIEGRLRRFRDRCSWFGLRRRIGQTLVVCTDHSVDGLGQVVQQMPAVGDLDGVRCAPA
ncbi:hypothetical protein D5S18_08115 [Nocardia panacis]|uniref:Uncharacterized protein n=1 Tax=Nocardia panacis TaxID=2340916 RepID=A0A3A4K8L6_9NOCA|nr:hypothetical protein D5S18_08115 [Nocardia panacis]